MTARVPVTRDSFLSKFATGPNGEYYYLSYDGLFQGWTHKRGKLIPNKGTLAAVKHAHKKVQLISASVYFCFYCYGMAVEKLWTVFGGRLQVDGLSAGSVILGASVILGVYVARLYASKQMARELASFESVPVKIIKT